MQLDIRNIYSLDCHSLSLLLHPMLTRSDSDKQLRHIAGLELYRWQIWRESLGDVNAVELRMRLWASRPTWQRTDVIRFSVCNNRSSH